MTNYLKRGFLGALLFVGPMLTPVEAVAHDGADGKVTHRHNEVRAQPDAEASWRDAQVGDLIYRQGRVNTLEESTAAVSMRDQGSVSMRANTLLIIYGHHALRQRKVIAMDAELERGALRTRLSELEGGVVASPSADTEIEGGNSLIKVDEEGTSRVHNHGEGKTEVKAKRGGKTAVKKGMGVKVKKKKRASKPIPLPPTPAWSGGPQVFLGVSGRISELRGSWAPVAEAESYFVEVATDAEGIDVISALEVPKTVSGFEVHGLPAGSYHVRVSSVDDDQFESIPSQAFEVELVDVGLVGPGGVEPMWPEDTLTPVPRVLPGTAMELPAGIRCAPAGEPRVARPMFVTPGVHELECEREDGAMVAPFTVEVPEIGPGARSDEGAGLSDAFELPRGQLVTRELVLDSKLDLPRELYLSGPEGLEIQEVRPGEQPGSWEVSLRADANVPDEVELGLSFVDPSSVELELPAFVRVSVKVVEPEPEPEPELGPERNMWELGVAGGLWALSERHGLVGPNSPQVPFMRPAGVLALRAGYYPRSWIGVELDGRLSPTRSAIDDSVLVYSARAQVLGQLPTRLTPYLSGGVQVLGVRSGEVALGSNADIGGLIGTGLKLYLDRRLALRAGVGISLHPAFDQGVATSVEFDLGLSWVIGRREPGSWRLKR